MMVGSCKHKEVHERRILTLSRKSRSVTLQLTLDAQYVFGQILWTRIPIQVWHWVSSNLEDRSVERDVLTQKQRSGLLLHML
jgi:hypothetical protein